MPNRSRWMRFGEQQLAAVDRHQAMPEGRGVWCRRCASKSQKRSCSIRSSFGLIFGLVFASKNRFVLSVLERFEEQKDRQRAHVDWLKNGDRDTQLLLFCYTCCSERKRRYKIVRLKGVDGCWIEEQTTLKEYISDQYRELFTSLATTDLEQLLEHVQPRVTPHMGESLSSVFTGNEEREALNGIGDLKAPGPDGMPGNIL